MSGQVQENKTEPQKCQICQLCNYGKLEPRTFLMLENFRYNKRMPFILCVATKNNPITSPRKQNGVYLDNKIISFT